MDENSVNHYTGIALQALGWILADAVRAQRFLDLTGLTPDELRAAIAEPATHRPVPDFPPAHEPDLVAAAEALGLSPAELAAVRDRIAA